MKMKNIRENAGDYLHTDPWDAPGMKISDFI